MSKVVLGVCLMFLTGIVVSYPAWSQVVGALYSSAALQPDSTTFTTSNDTAVAVSENTTEPDVFSLENTTVLVNSTSAVPFGPAWMTQFVGIVDGHRSGAPLADCRRLDSFAMTRFQTMTSGTNWEITHYGYSQDQGKAFGGAPGFYAEEYFYPNEPFPKTPQEFATLVQTTAPGHWSDLTNIGFKYYGAYYQGQGPVLLFQASCGPQELGAGVNQTSSFSGCPYQKVTGTWLVIELSSVCPP